MAVNKVQLGNQTIIDLTGDTISAGDALVGVSLHLASGESAVGTLGDFTGATSSTAGAHGLVPAPAAGDQNKVLKGDGTWGAIPTATSTVKKTFTLTANGWSQDSDSTYKYFATISGVDLTSVTDALVDVDMSNATVSTATDLLEDWSLVGRVYIDTLGAWFVCYGEPPIGNLPVVLRLTVEG